MENQTTVNIRIDPFSPWAARLNGSCELTSTTPRSLREVLSIVAKGFQHTETSADWLTAGNQSSFWRGLETFFWNELLPVQMSSGAFLSPNGLQNSNSAVDALVHILSNAVTFDAAGMRINLPVQSTGAVQLPEGPLSWILETGYPQEGSLSFTVFSDSEVNAPILIRLMGVGSPGGQLLRNGAACAMVFEEEYLRLEGPWRNGDHVEFRFGIPFAVRALGQKPVERGYPGAPPLSAATVWHGCRELVPLAQDSTGTFSSVEKVDAALAIGVRKDGVLILRADTDDHGSPFETPGDCFLSKDQPQKRLIAKALIGSLSGDPQNVRAADVTFTAFETSFDKGA